MSKKIQIPTRPPKKPTADQWVENKVVLQKERVKPKRLTIEIDPGLHRELKIHCASTETRIVDLIRNLISNELNSTER